jgi:nicotinamide riboside kinase
MTYGEEAMHRLGWEQARAEFIKQCREQLEEFRDTEGGVDFPTGAVPERYGCRRCMERIAGVFYPGVLLNAI